MAGLGLAGIGHVALKVADMERSLAFYRDRLGFAEMMRLAHDDGSLWLVYLRVTDTQFLELFPGGEGARAPGPDVTAVNHFCLEIRRSRRHRGRVARSRHPAHCRAKDGRRPQPPVLDRGSGRQPHRIHADDAQQHAGGRDQAPAFGGLSVLRGHMTISPTIIAASLLSSDFSRLGAEVEAVARPAPTGSIST